ncbi:hypothetical protein Dester_1502 [Desulfurobacterium thermolithotrophum DSM 11699]|uniref:Roadblock/LC7 family protein n=1 Tax=Desulfurobacterium thermolithotrophum (strain DSM 11699 / BSA) TaxID=868864 RepID=F0S2B4_DESTD|nr:hypothetical protein [Desulfurobacterium thermolithotrophum]ADY74129.1 hypothetical protein Dester_1502 [Desulfurobacterium thermolithotrophum DSM 11699]
MLKIFKKKDKEKIKNLREYLEKKCTEIEASGWIATAIFSSDGLKIFSKHKNKNYNVDKIYPYAIKLFQTASKFHQKAEPGLKIGGFEPPRALVCQLDTKEIILIMKGYSRKLDFFLIYIADPGLSVFFSIDKSIKKLKQWLFDVSQTIDDLITIRERK